mgnify:CR=1 FL=1
MGTPGAATAEVVDLQAIGLPRLVFALLRQRFSGLLSVPQAEPDAGERSVWFQGGMPIFTDWVSASDSLGQILVETGQLTPEERDRATLALQSPGPEAAASPRERLGHYPKHLSGGEQQRVALARAFAMRPKLLLADEPTGNLDAATGAQIIELMFDMNAEAGTTLILVTHDEALARRCGRTLRLAAGRLVS